jgi:hypothetical protein
MYYTLSTCAGAGGKSLDFARFPAIDRRPTAQGAQQRHAAPALRASARGAQATVGRGVSTRIKWRLLIPLLRDDVRAAVLARALGVETQPASHALFRCRGSLRKKGPYPRVDWSSVDTAWLMTAPVARIAEGLGVSVTTVVTRRRKAAEGGIERAEHPNAHKKIDWSRQRLGSRPDAEMAALLREHFAAQAQERANRGRAGPATRACSAGCCL